MALIPESLITPNLIHLAKHPTPTLACWPAFSGLSMCAQKREEASAGAYVYTVVGLVGRHTRSAKRSDCRLLRDVNREDTSYL